MKKLGELNIGNVHIEISYNDKAKYNPYRVYRKYWGLRRDGCGCTEHKEQLAKYADAESAVRFFSEYAIAKMRGRVLNLVDIL